MIKEDYVSFEVARLLRDKGFNGKCIYYYIQTKEMFEIDTKYHTALTTQELLDLQIIGEKEDRYAAPTQAIVMRWLREVHNLSVEVYRTACGYIGCITAIPSGTDIKFLETDGDDLPSGAYTKWEYACEAAIKYCLENLI